MVIVISLASITALLLVGLIVYDFISTTVRKKKK